MLRHSADSETNSRLAAALLLRLHIRRTSYQLTSLEVTCLTVRRRDVFIRHFNFQFFFQINFNSSVVSPLAVRRLEGNVGTK